MIDTQNISLQTHFKLAESHCDNLISRVRDASDKKKRKDMAKGLVR